jgi:hypothetical protein
MYDDDYNNGYKNIVYRQNSIFIGEDDSREDANYE